MNKTAMRSMLFFLLLVLIWFEFGVFLYFKCSDLYMYIVCERRSPEYILGAYIKMRKAYKTYTRYKEKNSIDFTQRDSERLCGKLNAVHKAQIFLLVLLLKNIHPPFNSMIHLLKPKRKVSKMKRAEPYLFVCLFFSVEFLYFVIVVNSIVEFQSNKVWMFMFIL